MVYEGNEKYIFISYAHKDSARVLPLVDALQANGFRVWYDSGIEAGTEWPEYIEDHLCRAGVVVAFMSPAAVASKNCRNEINLALELNKEVLVVYLEETVLAKGMRLQLNAAQSLFRMNHTSDQSFARELVNARILHSCRTAMAQPQTQYAPPRPVQSSTVISSVQSIGSKDSGDIWPKGSYSKTINRDVFCTIVFHINLFKPLGIVGTVPMNTKIYNADGYLVFDNTINVQVQPEYNRMATGWILKGDDGSFISSGEYKLVCSVNHSPEVSYSFTVCGDEDKVLLSRKSFGAKLRALFED